MNARQVQIALDLGCGVGRKPLYLSGQGSKLQGLDTLVAGTGNF
jgi:hypothetical protein